VLMTSSWVRPLAILAAAALIGLTGSARSFADIRQFTETIDFQSTNLTQNNFIQWQITGDGSGAFQPDAKLDSVTVSLTLNSASSFMNLRDFGLFFSSGPPVLGAAAGSLGAGTWQIGGYDGGGGTPPSYGAASRVFWSAGPANTLTQTFTAAQLSSGDINLADFKVWYGAAPGDWNGNITVSGQASFTYSAVPEPGSMALAGLGAVAFGGVVVRRRLKRRAAKS
jgi:hypothetical protein